MTRADIVNNKSYWQRQYNTLSGELSAAQDDLGKLEVVSGKLSEQYNIFDGYLNKRRNKLQRFSFLSGTGKIADGYLNGMSWDISCSRATGILSDISGSVSHVNDEISKLRNKIGSLRSEMGKCTSNYNYWDQKLREYDAAAAAAQSSGTTAQ